MSGTVAVIIISIIFGKVFKNERTFRRSGFVKNIEKSGCECPHREN
jgi:hypothetical protein